VKQNLQTVDVNKTLKIKKMKPLIFAIVFLSMVACGSEESEPKPDCAKLEKEAADTSAAYQAILDLRPPDNATQEAKDEWQIDFNEAKAAYTAAGSALAKADCN
jgi:hypothetical protein